jgi:hypothetical protein
LEVNFGIGHELNELENRKGELLGATVLLTPEEVSEARESGEVTLEFD